MFDDKRIPTASLKVGDTVGVQKPTQIGWSFFRYPMTLAKKIKRITPKGAKIITEDGCEYNTRQEWFYKITEESNRKTMIARCAVNIHKTLYTLEQAKSSGKLYNLTDEKIEKISRLMDEIKEVVGDV